MLVILPVTIVIGLCVALWTYRDIPIDVLEAKYANRASRFINIDGARIHFRDEGEGPAVLLLHASFGNLIDWDPWVDALRETHRVVRMDFTSHGLTGPDPSGDYSLERTLELTEKFINAMDLDKFSIAGSSLGGMIAIRFANKHPDRIENLILLSPESFKDLVTMANFRNEMSNSAFMLTYITPRLLTKYKLESGFGDKANLSDELIDRWHNMWRREGQREAQLDRLEQFDVGDIEDIIPALRPRTLLLWGEADPAVSLEQANEFQQRFENVKSLNVITYPNVGRLPAQEAGQKTGLDVRAFLDRDQLPDDETPEPNNLN